MTCKTHVDDVVCVLANIGNVRIAEALEAAVVFEHVEEGCAGGGSYHGAEPVGREGAVKPVLTERRASIAAGPVRSRQAANGNRAATDRSIQGRVFREVEACFFAAGGEFNVSGWVRRSPAENRLKIRIGIEEGVGGVGVVEKIVGCCGAAYGCVFEAVGLGGCDGDSARHEKTCSNEKLGVKPGRTIEMWHGSYDVPK